jgi:aquaporin Z
MMKPQMQKLLAELLGTFVLVFVGITAFAGGSNYVPFAFGLAMLGALYAFGEVSGGHFNPGVSLAMFLDRRLAINDLFSYWIAQFIGGILAALALLLMTSSDAVGTTATVPHGDRAAFFVELFTTAIFVAVVLQVTKSKGYTGTTFVAIALTLTAVHFAAIPFSGGSFNLARTLGPALVGTEWSGFWIYLLATPAGAILGWIAHTVAVKGDTNLRDDFDRVKSEVRDRDVTA